MILASRSHRSARFAGAALLAFALLAAGCGRPPDGAWLRFLGFRDGETNLTMISGTLRDNTALTADASFENRSLNVGQTAGVGVLVYAVRIDYRMARYSPPPVEYDCTLYLPPPADSKGSTGSLKAVLVPSSIKQWLIDTNAFKSAKTSPVVELTAHVTFSGETDEGGKIEAAGGIGIELSNAGETL